MTATEIIGIIVASTVILAFIGKLVQLIIKATKTLDNITIQFAERIAEHEKKYVHLTHETERRFYDETIAWRKKIEEMQLKILEELLKK